MRQNPMLWLCHTITVNEPRKYTALAEMARAAFDEHEQLKLRICELERELKTAKRAILYPMTDLA